MAKFEDYLPGGNNDPQPQAGGIDAEINQAQSDQVARQNDATPVDWETRFKNLEVHNSQQAQQLGDYRKIVDDFITSPTPVSEPAPEPVAITSDDLYSNPNESITSVVNAAVEAHPAIAAARNIEQQYEANQKEQEVNTFLGRHPDFDEIKQAPEFASWVQENTTRQALAQSANQYDMNSADALLSLYKAERGIAQVTQQAAEASAINAATLEESSAIMVSEPAQYSRAEFVDTKMRAEQGNQDAERWINRNVAKYREALMNGNVRD